MKPTEPENQKHSFGNVPPMLSWFALAFGTLGLMIGLLAAGIGLEFHETFKRVPVVGAAGSVSPYPGKVYVFIDPLNDCQYLVFENRAEVRRVMPNDLPMCRALKMGEPNRG